MAWHDDIPCEKCCKPVKSYSTFCVHCGFCLDKTEQAFQEFKDWDELQINRAKEKNRINKLLKRGDYDK